MGKKKKKSKFKFANIANLRRYDGARHTRSTSDWLTSSASVDSDLRSDLVRLRNRSRDLIRNNPYLKHAIQATLPNNIIGTGFGFQSQVKRKRGDRLNEEINEQIEEAWTEWQQASYCHTAGKLTFGDLQRLAIKSVAESGEVLFRKIRSSFGGCPIPIALEVIEADQLCDSHGVGAGYGGNLIKMGVELNEWQRPVAYHLYPYHPGDTQFTRAVENGKLIRVMADDIYHLFVCDRPGQTRGVPWLHAVINRIRQMGAFEDAKITTARAQALINAFIVTPDPENVVLGSQDETGDRSWDLDSGEAIVLQPGEQVQAFVPSTPNDNGSEFLKSLLRSVATAIGISYEAFTGDFSETSYSSARTALLQERDCYQVLQVWFINQFLMPFYSEWLDVAVLSGRVKIDDYFQNRSFYCKPKFTSRGWAWVDPLKEVNANVAAVKAGMKTLTDIAAESGKDFEEIVKTRRREMDLLASYNVSVETEVQPEPEPIIMTEKQFRRLKYKSKIM
jgi:lambda family phage portal protein